MHRLPPRERRVAGLRSPATTEDAGHAPSSIVGDFLKLVGASAGAAAAAGCSRARREADPVRGAARGDHAGHRGLLRVDLPGVPGRLRPARADARGPPDQARGQPRAPDQPRRALRARPGRSIGRTYHPDRYHEARCSAAPPAQLERDRPGTRRSRTFAAASRRAPARRVACSAATVGPTLGGCSTRGSPPSAPAAASCYEPFAPEALRDAHASGVRRRRSRPIFDLSSADFVIDFGSDFLESGLSPVEHARQLAEARDVAKHAGRAARGSSTWARGSRSPRRNADEWLAAKPGSEGILALALARVAIEHGAGGRAPTRRCLGASLAGVRRRRPPRSRPTCRPTTIERIGTRARAGEAPRSRCRRASRSRARARRRHAPRRCCS